MSVSSVPPERSLLKPPRMSPDSVVIEFALLDVPDSQRDAFERLWNTVDEQHLPVDQRRILAAHGLRCGVLGAQLPDWVRQRLESSRKSVKLDRDTGTASFCGLLTCGRMQCRAGKRRPVAVGATRETLTIEPAPGLQATCLTYEDAQCQFALVAQPLGDGRARLHLTPEVAHGPPHQRWIGSDGLFRPEVTRPRKEFPEAQITATLLPGQTLLVAATPKPQGLGKAFFVDGPQRAGTQQVLLLRLAQTQYDDLFAPEKAATPIATPAQ